MSGNLIRCQNGHLFSSRRYGTVCPYCNIETATKEKKSVEKSQEEIEDILFLEEEHPVCEHSCNSNPDTVDGVYDTGYDTECDQIPHSLIPDVPFAAEYKASLDWEVDTLTNYHCDHICTEIRKSAMLCVITNDVPFKSLTE